MSTYDEDYYRANGQLGDRPALGFYVRLVSRYIGAGPYLDFGCGTGHLLRRLSQLGDASGFEVSEFSAERARQTAPGTTVVTSMDDLPSNAFGGITSIHVLEHLDDETAESVLATWRRVLGPGGRVLAVMPDPASRARRLMGAGWNGFSDPTHINLKPHRMWADFVTSRGFAVVREGSDGLWNPPYRARPRLVDAGIYSVPAFGQYLAGRIVLRPGTGESSIFVLEKN
jgi:SAM-dependent methyltransferase